MKVLCQFVLLLVTGYAAAAPASESHQNSTLKPPSSAPKTLETGRALPDTTCKNSGIQWGYFNNPAGPSVDSNYSNFKVGYLQKSKPIVQGTTRQAGTYYGDCNGNTTSIYGHTENCQRFALMYRGYFYAATTGKYRFSTWNVDDIVLVWTGQHAYRGYTRSNALAIQAYGGKNTENFIQLNQGQYLPLRIVFANSQGGYHYALEIDDPNGTTVVGPNINGSDYLVKYPCNKKNGLPFPKWGQESGKPGA